MVAYEMKKQETEKTFLITLYSGVTQCWQWELGEGEISRFLATKNHRVMEWFGWEGTLKLISF